MKLLTFAHRAEAQAFLKNLPFKSIPCAYADLYKTSTEYLLITKEGHFQSSQKVAATLSIFPEIKTVFNFGIAASINLEIPLESIIQIRTSYKESDNVNAMEFKSHSAKRINDINSYDCVTTNTRILKGDHVRYIENFGEIIDRELWGIASSATLFEKEFSSFKLISDYAHTDDREFCKIIKEKASDYSVLLFNFYSEHFKSDQNEESILQIRKGTSLDEFLNDKNEYFHITKSLENKLIKTINTLNLKMSKYEIFKKVDLDSIKDIHPNKKQRAIILSNKLNDLMNPYRTEIENKLNQSLNALKEVGFETRLPRDLEGEEVSLLFKLNDQKQVVKIKEALEDFDYNNTLKIFRGNFDV